MISSLEQTQVQPAVEWPPEEGDPESPPPAPPRWPNLPVAVKMSHGCAHASARAVISHAASFFPSLLTVPAGLKSVTLSTTLMDGSHLHYFAHPVQQGKTSAGKKAYK
jgi:hypothetical protein